MKLLLSDFCRNLSRILRENKRIVWRAVLILLAALLVFLTIRGVVEWAQGRNYEKRVHALEAVIKDAEQRARDAEGRAAVIQEAIETKNAEINELEKQVAIADRKIQQTRTVYLPLKETYENTRIAPLPAAPVSCADICAELARLGYPCR